MHRFKGSNSSVDSASVSLCRLKVFEASDFGSHPLFSVAQGGMDLQQVSMAAGGPGTQLYFICQQDTLTQALKGVNSLELQSVITQP